MLELPQPCAACPRRHRGLSPAQIAAIEAGEIRPCVHGSLLNRGECHGALAHKLELAPKTRLLLVGCGKTKQAKEAPARELYTGNLFAARRAYAEAAGAPWWVISAKHHLVSPDATLAPYDLALTELNAMKRTGWGCEVALMLWDAVQRLGLDPLLCELEIHAGAAYVDALRTWATNIRIHTPLEGLGVGQQLAWYKAQLSATKPTTTTTTTTTQ